MYLSAYENSWALVIGINTYRHISPLGFARHDAEAIANILTDQFGFPKDSVTLLLDKAATREAIMNSFLSFAHGTVKENDRILVFFAGHGHTHLGRRGEVGYLVPMDGTPANLATLVRWDDLTRNADLLPAKHILFIMDACYGGLALMRSPGPGSMRYLKDMLQRHARQVLTAGKADEEVADAGGPIPNHSVFTGHLIQALQGNAATSDGIISANSVMAYVYDKVAKDLHSQQTPHYGFTDGDGDFIFTAPMLDALSSQPEIDQDVLIEIPPDLVSVPDMHTQTDMIELVQEYLPDPRYRIKLDSLATSEIRKVLYLTTNEHFPVNTINFSPEELARRLYQYESIVKDLKSMVILLSYWGADEQKAVLRKIIARVTDKEIRDGIVAWLRLRRYPSLLLLYAGGIAAIASDNYGNLATLLTTQVGTRHSSDQTEPVITSIVSEFWGIDVINAFKTLPGHERQYVPISEYLFKVLQPSLDDLLFLGTTYEALFDRFEVFLALIYADDNDRDWGPPGRFAWKHSSRMSEGSPFMKVVEEAKSQGPSWPPLRAGLFGGSIDRFVSKAEGYLERLKRLNWW